jgi:hypothetical protein
MKKAPAKRKPIQTHGGELLTGDSAGSVSVMEVNIGNFLSVLEVGLEALLVPKTERSEPGGGQLNFN